MQKEILKLSNVITDLRKIADFQDDNTSEGKLAYIVPIAMVAVVMGALLQRVWIGILIFLLAAPTVVGYVKDRRAYYTRKKALTEVIERADISISVERLSHIAEEVIYEPHVYRGHRHTTKLVILFHFESGVAWRVPDFIKHYPWSKEYRLTPRGLENTLPHNCPEPMAIIAFCCCNALSEKRGSVGYNHARIRIS